jgi:hypothetical protein
VAHGLGWLQAMAAARASGLQLITVVHDWYPDASGCPLWGLWIWERSFRQLMCRSVLIFAVSEGMARQLGPHPNLQVLPPIPDPALLLRSLRRSLQATAAGVDRGSGGRSALCPASFGPRP